MKKLKWLSLVSVFGLVMSAASFSHADDFKVDLDEKTVRSKMGVLTVDDLLVGETAYVDPLAFCQDERSNVRIYKGQPIVTARDKVGGILTKIKIMPDQRFQVSVKAPKDMDSFVFSQDIVELFRGIYVSCNYNKSRGVLPLLLDNINGSKSLSALFTKPFPKE